MPGLELAGGLCEVAGREEDVVDLQAAERSGSVGEVRTAAPGGQTSGSGPQMPASFVANAA